MLNNWQYHLVVGPRGNNLSDRLGGGAIAQWICLCLPSCCPRLESQSHHLCFYHLQPNLCYFCRVKKMKINKNRTVQPIFKTICQASLRMKNNLVSRLKWASLLLQKPQKTDHKISQVFFCKNVLKSIHLHLSSKVIWDPPN